MYLSKKYESVNKISCIFSLLFFLSGCSISPIREELEVRPDVFDVQMFGARVQNSLDPEDVVLQGYGILLSAGMGQTVGHLYREDLYYYFRDIQGLYTPVELHMAQDGIFFSHTQDGAMKVQVDTRDRVYVGDDIVEIQNCTDEFCMLAASCAPGDSGRGVYQDNGVIGLVEATNGIECLVRIFK